MGAEAAFLNHRNAEQATPRGDRAGERRWRIGVIGADTLMRRGLLDLFRCRFGLLDCAEARSLQEIVLRGEPGADILLALHWPGDFAAPFEQLRGHWPSLARRLIVLCGEPTMEQARHWIACGVRGVLADRLDADAMVAAMSSIFRGEQTIDIGCDFDEHAPDLRRLPAAILKLRPRSREVLDLLCEGCSTAEIAVRFGISERTVKWHMTDLLSVLKLRSRFQAVALVTRLRCACHG